MTADLIRDDDARRAVTAKLKASKRAFTEAARLAMSGDKDAALKATAALRAVNQAMAELRAIDLGEQPTHERTKP